MKYQLPHFPAGTKQALLMHISITQNRKGDLQIVHSHHKYRLNKEGKIVDRDVLASEARSVDEVLAAVTKHLTRVKVKTSKSRLSTKSTKTVRKLLGPTFC